MTLIRDKFAPKQSLQSSSRRLSFFGDVCSSSRFAEKIKKKKGSTSHEPQQHRDYLDLCSPLPSPADPRLGSCAMRRRVDVVPPETVVCPNLRRIDQVYCSVRDVYPFKSNTRQVTFHSEAEQSELK